METVTPSTVVPSLPSSPPFPSPTPTSTILAKNDSVKNAEPSLDGVTYIEEASMHAFMFGDGPNPKTVRLVRARSQPLSSSSASPSSTQGKQQHHGSASSSSSSSPVLLARIGYFASTYDQNGLQSGLEWSDGIRLLALSPRFIENIGCDGNSLRIKLLSSIENGKTIWFSPLPRLDDGSSNIPNDGSANASVPIDNVSPSPNATAAAKDAEAWSIFAHACTTSMLSYWRERINRREAAHNRNSKNSAAKKSSNNDSNKVSSASVSVRPNSTGVIPTTDPSLPHGGPKPIDNNSNEATLQTNDNDDNNSVSRPDSVFGINSGTSVTNNNGVRLPSGQIVPARKDRAGMSRKEYRQMLLERNSNRPNDTDNGTVLTNDISSNNSTMNPNHSHPYPSYGVPPLPPSHQAVTPSYSNDGYDDAVSNRESDMATSPPNSLHRANHNHNNASRTIDNSATASAFTSRNVNNNHPPNNFRASRRPPTATVMTNGNSTPNNGSFMASLFSNHRNTSTNNNGYVSMVVPNNDSMSTMISSSTVMDSSHTVMITPPPLPPYDPVSPSMHIHTDYANHHYGSNPGTPREYYSTYLPTPPNYSPYATYSTANVSPSNYSTMNMIPMNYNPNLSMNYNPSTNGIPTMSLVQLPNGMMGMVIPTSTAAPSTDTLSSNGATGSSKNGHMNN